MSKIVSYEQVKELKNKPEVLFIDVREQHEIESTGLIPGSKNIPAGMVEEALTILSDKELSEKYGIVKPNKDTPIVTTCRSGKRAKAALEKLENLGFTNVKYYEGSWLEWEQKNGS